ncbi:helix-turn-helix transcriptional regulator [Mucilaginibacter gilvus]|uniref:AraC family transcriptional regulator n=1 Tax=Mucilaginibacter gilvus TaxID=2305909 RepID=A0A3S3VH29_9SPHI|nr:helix-turn-helix transcriptional regulator [Mucilaginibacter gilvus]RWY48165.1 AraC family transcriptional regulator [Mucilaginibacter gilvus]
MRYREYIPGSILKRYVQCYFTCESDTHIVTEDKVFASGKVELMFNLGDDGPQRLVNGGLLSQPRVQLWGQTIRPFTFTSSGKHAMLGIRFFAHTAACFFEEPIADFNDQVTDFHDVAGKHGRLLYEKLLDAPLLTRRIALIEEFLLARLLRFQPKMGKLKLMNSIIHSVNHDDLPDNINAVAARYGISSRYLQKVFLAYSGLTPNPFGKISRFQKSLQLVTQKELPLTTIAHSCGYYDQSHFIKDFKFFTGFTPSHFQPESSTDLFVPLSN